MSLKFFTRNALHCELCPHNCKINRFSEALGICGVNDLRISAWNLHYGEEPAISGKNGSGAIFFSGCSLKCRFCQNYPISQFKYGKNISIEELSHIMLSLEKKGANNINLVTPTHLSHLIIPAIELAKANGLHIPIAYNTSGYENPLIVENLFQYIDIFLYDMKYSSNDTAWNLSGIKNYVENNRKSFEMILESKNNIINKGIMKEGIIVRHLVIPNHIDNTLEVLEYLSQYKEKIFISLMFQYFPAYKAVDDTSLNRKINKNEYDKVIKFFDKKGFSNGWVQELFVS